MRSTAFFPPGFAHTSFDKVVDEDVGVTFQAGYETSASYNPPKVMKYEPQQLIFSLASWRALLTTTFDATAVRGLILRVAGFNFLALVASSLTFTPFASSRSEQAMSELNSLLGTGLFFILGPFVGFAVTRWWQVRFDGIGALWGAVDDLSTWASSWFSAPALFPRAHASYAAKLLVVSGAQPLSSLLAPSRSRMTADRKTVADHAARALVLRYGLLSHALLYKEARQETELDDLVSAGLLHEHEAATLQPLSSKPLVVWAWMASFWQRALGGHLGCTHIEHASMLAPMVHDRCMRGRGAIGTALAVIDTQQPFPYVHLLSLITDVALSVNAATVGLQTGRHLLGAEAARAEAPLIIACALVRVTAFVLCIGGLLSIGVHLDNPAGDDASDFPALAYQVMMRKECESITIGIDAVDLRAGWWVGLAKNQSTEPELDDQRDDN